MRDIKSEKKNLMGVLQNAKYTLHYYQREYRWQRKHIEELLYDLTTEFLENYKSNHSRKDIKNYSAYFMGSIVLAGDENALIDGQQRLSSLTLLLMYLNNRLRKINLSHTTIDQMIFSERFGEKSFNMNVPERQDCMTAIYNNELNNFDAANTSESVKNLRARYTDIEEIFSEKISITDEMIIYFCDWLIEQVYFVAIIAETDQDAHKIFVTMNDRGLSLTPAEMLKGYLLSEITDDTKRKELNDAWKQTVLTLREDNDKSGDETFIKAWLRAQYAKGNDFDAIGGTFHKWVRDNRDKLNLKSAEDHEQFLNNFLRFAKIYKQIKHAEKDFTQEMKYVYYNAQLNFTLQPMFLMAPICLNDDEDTVVKKINLTARFIDLLINAKVTNHNSVEQRVIKDLIFTLTSDIRGCSINELKSKLKNHYIALDYDASVVIPKFILNQFTRKYIKNILARITSFIEERTNGTPRYVEYMASSKDPFEIEHIICSDFEKYKRRFSRKDFDNYRDSIGALLLLPKSINSSLSDKKYKSKLNKYCSANIYAASLGEQTYQNNPRLKNFIDANNLSFEPFKKFEKPEIEKRIQLVVELVNLVWNTEEFQ